LVWSLKNGLIDRAPHVERPPNPDPKEGYLTREEVMRLMARAS
jgi:hypothetical protein